jgi:hypothetical protein
MNGSDRFMFYALLLIWALILVGVGLALTLD